MDTRLLAFRTLYKQVHQESAIDITAASLMFSTLVYFSNDFIEKIVNEIQAEEYSINEINGLKFIYVKYRDNRFIAFRGTEASKWSNLKRVLNFIPKKGLTGKKAHRGFLMAFADCKRLIDSLIPNPKSVIFTGHSLGGALALIAADNYKTSCVAFASPKVFFNEKTKPEVSYLGYRVVGDFVPHLPPTTFLFSWTRSKPEFWIRTPKMFINPFGYHRVATYIDLLMEKFNGTNKT